MFEGGIRSTALAVLGVLVLALGGVVLYQTHSLGKAKTELKH